MITKDILNVIGKNLENNKKELRELEHQLSLLPLGTIHYKSHKYQSAKYFQYVPAKSSNKNWNNSEGKSKSNKLKRQVYLKRTDNELKSLLAQKRFIIKCIKIIKLAIVTQAEFLNSFTPYDPYDIYDSMPDLIKDLYIKSAPQHGCSSPHWFEEPYEKSQMYPENLIYRSPKGLKVRSKSESIIAGLLESEGIQFRYEAALKLNGTTYYPDFTLLCPRNNRIVFWEHFGMADKEEYVISMTNKISTYRKNGIFPWYNLIETYETEDIPFDAQQIRMIIHNFLLS